MSADSARLADTRPEWFVVGHGRKPFGPYSMARLRAYAKDGRLAHASLVWRKGMPAWVRADSVPGLMDSPVPRDKPRPPSGQSPTPPSTAGPATARPAAPRVPGLFGFDSVELKLSFAASLVALAIVIYATIRLVIDVGPVGARGLIILVLVGLVSLPLGWAFTRLGRQMLSNTPTRISNRLVLSFPGILALLVAAIIGVVTAFAVLEGLSPTAFVPAGVGIGVLVAFACYALLFDPRDLGIQIDATSTIGEESVALWGIPFRIALASAGAAMMVVQVVSVVAGIVAVVAPLVDGDEATVSKQLWSEVAISSGGAALLVGFWPVIAYYLTVLQYLLLGTAESVQQVGRHLRERKSGQAQGQAEASRD